MKTFTSQLAAGLFAMTFAVTAQAGGYLKLGDIPGESADSSPAASQTVKKAGKKAGAETRATLLLPAVQQAREAARRMESSNNLKQLGLGSR